VNKHINWLQSYMKQQGGVTEDSDVDPQPDRNVDHRELIFDEEKRSEYLWCLHCQRTYKRGQFRWEGDFQMCPYEDCDGTTVLDGIDWESIRDDCPDYPVTPESNRVYPMCDGPDDEVDDEELAEEEQNR